MQNVKLNQLEIEKTVTSTASAKEMNLLKNKIKTFNSIMEDGKAKTLNLIALGQK